MTYVIPELRLVGVIQVAQPSIYDETLEPK
jgi:hypothetical protein